MKPHTVVLKDKTQVNIRPSIEADLEPSWEMLQSLSKDSLQFIPDPLTREQVEEIHKNIDYTRMIPLTGYVYTENGLTVVCNASIRFQRGIYRHKARIGIIVCDEYQNRGLGQRVTSYMLDIARDCGLKKVELSAVSHNHRAIHIYQKMGFEREGFTRMDHWNPFLERYGDSVHMGLMLS